MYAGTADPNNYLISPINGSLKGLGHITIFIGTHDLLIADCRKLERQAEKEHVKIGYHEYKSMMHDWMLFSFPESKNALKQIIETINDRNGNRS
jgi:acetyl esterase/lipase